MIKSQLCRERGELGLANMRRAGTYCRVEMAVQRPFGNCTLGIARNYVAHLHTPAGTGRCLNRRISPGFIHTRSRNYVAHLHKIALQSVSANACGFESRPVFQSPPIHNLSSLRGASSFTSYARFSHDDKQDHAIDPHPCHWASSWSYQQKGEKRNAQLRDSADCHQFHSISQSWKRTYPSC